MFCLFSNIFICGINELSLLNLANYNYIINCENKFNNMITSPNYINLNIENFNEGNFNLLSDIYTWIENNFANNKIILLDETGQGNAMFLSLYLIMRSKNENFISVYTNTIKYTNLLDINYYKLLAQKENEIIKKNFFFQLNHMQKNQEVKIKNNSMVMDF